MTPRRQTHVILPRFGNGSGMGRIGHVVGFADFLFRHQQCGQKGLDGSDIGTSQAWGRQESHTIVDPLAEGILQTGRAVRIGQSRHADANQNAQELLFNFARTVVGVRRGSSGSSSGRSAGGRQHERRQVVDKG